MKNVARSFAILLVLLANQGFSQSAPQSALLKQSHEIFRLEVENRIDSLAFILDDHLVVLNSAGATQAKAQYLERLKSGNFRHDDIRVEESAATIAGNTGVVTGKGTFTITANDKQSVLHLAYSETFTRTGTHAEWKLLALHASAIPSANP